MIYDIKVLDIKGEELSMSIYKGKVLLVVNTATQCGLTPQYQGLQNLYEEYANQGFEILEFPCNQFFEQAPESDSEINAFCELRYSTTFKRFAKIDVNGDNAHELYKLLRSKAPSADDNITAEVMYKILKAKGFDSSDDEIKWNFTKFLIDRNGNVIKRFSPTDKPKKIEKDIKLLLK